MQGTDSSPTDKELLQEQERWQAIWKVNSIAPNFDDKIVKVSTQITSNSIRVVAKTFSYDTSCTDGLPLKMIYLLSEDIRGSMADLMNAAIITGGLPQQLKHTTVKLIDKKREAFDLSFYIEAVIDYLEGS